MEDGHAWFRRCLEQKSVQTHALDVDEGSALQMIRLTSLQRESVGPCLEDVRTANMITQGGSNAQPPELTWYRKANPWNLFQRHEYLGHTGRPNFKESMTTTREKYQALSPERKQEFLTLCSYADDFGGPRKSTWESRFGPTNKTMLAMTRDTQLKLAFQRVEANRRQLNARHGTLHPAEENRLAQIADTALCNPGIAAIDDILVVGNATLHAQRVSRLQEKRNERETVVAWRAKDGKAESAFLEKEAPTLGPILGDLVPMPSTTHHVRSPNMMSTNNLERTQCV